ncbi:MAG: hypothetical protein AB2653_09435 [Candidatus Thiodiazotropha endolucinida]
MNEESKEMKIREYQERYRFWTDKRISQLSFHNDFMLTLAIAAIGYLWSQRNDIYTNLRIDFGAKIDWAVVLFLLGIIAVAFSIISGFILSLSRLYDLRVTSNVLLTRKRSIKKGIDLKDEKLSHLGFKGLMNSLFCVLRRYRSYEITVDDISENNELQSKFTELRQMSRNLGNLTWSLLNWQAACLFVGIVFSMFVLVIK